MFGASSKEIIVMHSEKTHERMEGKIHERGCVKEFFRKLPVWYLVTSLQINFFTCSFQGF